MTTVLVLYYSSYGHIEQMAGAVAEGLRAPKSTSGPCRKRLRRRSNTFWPSPTRPIPVTCSSAVPGHAPASSSICSRDAGAGGTPPIPLSPDLPPATTNGRTSDYAGEPHRVSQPCMGLRAARCSRVLLR